MQTYDPWVKLVLRGAPWSEARRAEALRLRATALHLGEVAEALNCSVFEVQAELEIGHGRDVRSYRAIRRQHLEAQKP